MKKVSQDERVLAHLSTRDGITSMEAFYLYGITRLSAVIYRLRKRGYNIAGRDEAATNRYGDIVYFTRYTLGRE